MKRGKYEIPNPIKKENKFEMKQPLASISRKSLDEQTEQLVKAARHAIQMRDFNRAIELAKECIALSKGQKPDGYDVLGRCYFKMNDHEKALEAYQTALSLREPNDIFNMDINKHKIAACLIRMYKFDEATSVLDNISDKENRYAIGLTAKIKRQQGNYSKTFIYVNHKLQEIKLKLEKGEQSKTAKNRLKELETYLIFQLGIAAKDAKDFVAAKRYLSLCSKQDSGELRVASINKLASIYIEEGNLKEAIAKVKTALQNGWMSAIEGNQILANIFLLTGDLTNSRESQQKAINLAPCNDKSHLLGAQISLAEGNISKTLDELMIIQNSKSIRTQDKEVIKGAIALSLQRPTDALTCLEKVVTHGDPSKDETKYAQYYLSLDKQLRTK